MKIKGIILCVLLVLLLAACGVNDPSLDTESDGETAEPIATLVPKSEQEAESDEQAEQEAEQEVGQEVNEVEETKEIEQEVEETEETQETEQVEQKEEEIEQAVDTQSKPNTESESSAMSNPLIEGASNDPPSQLRSAVQSWATDWSLRTISLEELFSGGPPRDGIPPIDEPTFISIDDATQEVAETEPIVVYEHQGDARAYPLAILIWHEIVNDTVGGQPVSITFCPLCNTAIAFDRNYGDQVLDFGTSGLLRNSDLVMWDRQTETLWQQATGEGIVGQFAGQSLDFLPASVISFNEFRERYPDGQVLSRETGHDRRYGNNPYTGYDGIGSQPFLYSGEIDERLPAMERVVGLIIGTQAVAYPFSTLAEAGVVNDEVNGQSVAVFFAPDTVSALDATVIEQARAVGSAVSYNPIVNGDHLIFKLNNNKITDTNTGSEWDVTGRATSGSLTGTQLDILPHANHFWFAFAAFYPDSTVWQP